MPMWVQEVKGEKKLGEETARSLAGSTGRWPKLYSRAPTPTRAVSRASKIDASKDGRRTLAQWKAISGKFAGHR